MAFAIIIISFLVLLGTLFWQASLLWATMIGSPIVYSFKQAVRDCLNFAGVKKGDTVIDLGCGNGGTLILAAREFGAKGIGVDRSVFCYIRAKMNVYFSGQRNNIKIILGSFEKAEKELKKADVVYLYLLDSTLAKMEDWLFHSIGKNTKVVSLAFEFQKHKPVKEIDTSTLHRKTKARLYGR